MYSNDRAKEQARKAREQAQKLEAIQSELYDDLFRGVTKTADALIRDAEQNKAERFWLEFATGLKELFREDYPEFKTRLEEAVRLKPESTAARSLLALAFHVNGDDAEYFKRLADIQTSNVESFEDKVFVGYAQLFANPTAAISMFQAAEETKANQQFVQLLLGMAKRHHVSLEVADPSEALPIINQAHEAITAVRKLMSPASPLLLREEAFANIERANIYRKLAAEFPNDAEQHLSQREQSLRRLGELIRPLEGFQDNPDAQLALCHIHLLLDESELTTLAARWDADNVPVAGPAIHVLVIHFIRTKEFDLARKWFGKLQGHQVDTYSFAGRLIELADPNSSQTIESLVDETKKQVDRKLASGNTQFLAWDGWFLVLLGDESGIQYFSKDALQTYMYDGKLFAPHGEYFRVDRGDDWTRSRLIRECKSTAAQNAALTHAYFGFGIEDIHRHEDSARANFQNCIEHGPFHLYAPMISAALLTNADQWKRWAQQAATKRLRE